MERDAMNKLQGRIRKDKVIGTSEKSCFSSQFKDVEPRMQLMLLILSHWLC